jgi:hypothetical protein
MPFWITWKHTNESFAQPLTFENKVEIFYERFFGWQLNIANTMANSATDAKTGEQFKSIPHSDFATLSVCMSYFEMIGKYEAGYIEERDSLDNFKKGLISVFPEIASWEHIKQREFIREFYSRVRCGLYHVAMTGSNVGVTSDDYCIYMDKHGTIAINPHKLPVRLLQHLQQYRDKLLDISKTNLRNNFERRFNLDNGIKEVIQCILK